MYTELNSLTLFLTSRSLWCLRTNVIFVVKKPTCSSCPGSLETFLDSLPVHRSIHCKRIDQTMSHLCKETKETELTRFRADMNTQSFFRLNEIGKSSVVHFSLQLYVLLKEIRSSSINFANQHNDNCQLTQSQDKNNWKNYAQRQTRC